MASSSLPQRQSPLYFAYGSNLHLGQMAKRCPESRYVGRGRLHNWRFHINNRRYANVKYSLGSYVEGLVYRLSLTDEAKLDKFEGFPTAYQKYNLVIDLFTTPIEHVARAVPELAKELEASEHYMTNENKNLGRSASRNRRSLARWHKKPSRRDQAEIAEQIDKQPGYDHSGGLQHPITPRGQPTQALVYLSTNHVQDGKPWDEYIDRMNSGIIDARKLGLSDIYVEHCLRHYIRDRALPSQVLTPAPENPDHRYQRSRESSRTRHSSLEPRHRPRGRDLRSKSAGPAINWGRMSQPKNTRAYYTRDDESDRYNESSRYHNDRRSILSMF